MSLTATPFEPYSNNDIKKPHNFVLSLNKAQSDTWYYKLYLHS